ncbi:MAG: hypothetical protein GMKNLPBB_00977 [Myxococcota bacterium]|nr:hypothetical protein [Myxococcota bacterium]
MFHSSSYRPLLKLLFAAGAAALALTGCFPESEVAGSYRCDEGGTCPTGLSCFRGRCLEKSELRDLGLCSEDSDCPTGRVCRFLQCVNPDEIPPADAGSSPLPGSDAGQSGQPDAKEEGCQSHRDCGIDRVCRERQCLRPGDCKGNNDCPVNWACQADSLQCVRVVECGEDLDCQPYAPRTKCTAEGRCIDPNPPPPECTSNENCDPVNTDRKCASGKCVPAQTCRTIPSICAAGEICDRTQGRCAANARCSANADCAADPRLAVCNPASGKCVECLANAECGFGRQCNLTSLTCEDSPVIKCKQDRDCPSTGKKKCHPNLLECVECLSSPDCPVGVCNLVSLACDGVDKGDDLCLLECQNPTTDPNNPQRCPNSSKICIPFLQGRGTAPGACIPASYRPGTNPPGQPGQLDGRCGAVTPCSQGVCVTVIATVACRADRDCAQTANTKKCLTAEQRCVQCLSNGDCPSGKCDTGRNICLAGSGCSADADCPAGQRCNASRQCETPITPPGCRNDSECASLGPGYKCISGGCKPPANPGTCATNTDCTPPEVCDPVSKTCTTTPQKGGPCTPCTQNAECDSAQGLICGRLSKNCVRRCSSAADCAGFSSNSCSSLGFCSCR